MGSREIALAVVSQFCCLTFAFFLRCCQAHEAGLSWWGVDYSSPENFPAMNSFYGNPDSPMSTSLLYKNFPVAGLPHKAPTKEVVVFTKKEIPDSQQRRHQGLDQFESDSFAKGAMSLFD